MSVLRALVKNSVKESFYGKRKKIINILTVFFISHKSNVKIFFNWILNRCPKGTRQHFLIIFCDIIYSNNLKFDMSNSQVFLKYGKLKQRLCNNINIRHNHNFICYVVYYILKKNLLKKQLNINFICLNLVRILNLFFSFSFLLGIKGLVWLENSNNYFQFSL